MSRTIAITGSASGIGAATQTRLERAGARVIGIDLRGADVSADLSVPEGREAAISGILARCGTRLDGLVLCAGLGPHVDAYASIVSVNFFGAQALLSGLREALSHGTDAAAVAVSSNSSTLPNSDGALVTACLDGDEDRARAIALAVDGQHVYAGSKLALARWIRRQAPRAEWAGAGIRLNAVAPGVTMTPLLQGGLDHPLYGPAIRNFPIPTGSFATPDQVATVICFLLSTEAAFCCGSVFFVDGGTDALLRPDAF